MHISYKGTVLALNDVMGGQVQALFSDMPIALPHAKTGKLRALAVTGPKRSPLVQGMPTVAEAGVAGYALVNWWGILAPRGLPPAVAEKLAREIARVHTQAEITERYAGLGVEAAGSTAAEFTEYIKAEEVRFAKVLKETGVKLD
jgi:tripartite-type tricarboxylate transporter receptor subunit TctC